MENNYTFFNQQSISEYSSIDDTEQAMDYLKDPSSFRSFDIGLIELLKRKGYPTEQKNVYEMSDYLCSKLKSINSSIEKETVLSWFTGKHQPKIDSASRIRMYEICFSLNLTYNETVWFFQHVYYDRAFNCHTINEAVFCFAFMNNISYQESLNIIQEINEAPIISLGFETEANYTKFVQSKISEFKTTDELKEFLIANKENFKSWNKSALKKLNELRTLLIGSDEIKSEFSDLKRRLRREIDKTSKKYSLNLDSFKNYGLLIQEIVYDLIRESEKNPEHTPEETFLGIIDKRNIFSYTFILEQLALTSEGMKKNYDIPYIVRNNFPSKKTMSDVLSEEKVTVSKSYDSIRKTIILLDFYRFWISVKLGKIYTEFSKDELRDIYVDEAADLLYNCGYEELSAVNPYDWLFLSSAQSDDPLSYFRGCMNELLP